MKSANKKGEMTGGGLLSMILWIVFLILALSVIAFVVIKRIIGN